MNWNLSSFESLPDEAAAPDLHNPMDESALFAFYDFDGTLADSNVVQRYAYLARRQPSRFRAAWKTAKLFLSIPWWIALDIYSRRAFNLVFYREYAGLEETWLREQGEVLFERVIQPRLFAGAKELVERDCELGYTPVLVTGELDFTLGGVVRHFAFRNLISNALVFKNGRATGEVVPPLIAEKEKVAAMNEICQKHGVEMLRCKAYSDSFSDVPMLEAVGKPAAVNPDRRLKRVAAERGWPILDLKKKGA